MGKVKVGLLGLGTVGAGTVQVLRDNQLDITRRCGSSIDIVAVSTKNPEKARGIDVNGLAFMSSQALVEDPNLDIVVELIGGTDVAKELVAQALRQKKHVVTANKALIATHGNELFDLAYQNDCILAFEASVAGGIPIIKSIREGLGANQISQLVGIINGTCNYILSKMRQDGLSYETALSQAKALGYAEADESFDVDGIDAAHKCAILGSIAFGIPLSFDKVFTQSIRTIQTKDVEYAGELGYEIKQLSVARAFEHGIELRVSPCLIPNDAMLSSVNGAMNAVWVMANAVGPTMYYGQGAGAGPTASAVVADIMEVARLLESAKEHRVPSLAFQKESLSSIHVLEPDHYVSGAYLRIQVEDKPGMLAKITNILAHHEISVNLMLQKDEHDERNCVPLVLLTYACAWGATKDAIKAIEALDGVHEDVVWIAMEDIDS